jgi:hypothetical protein
MSSLSTQKFAWCLAIWGKPQYLVGAIATAHSLREVKTQYDIVLLYNGLDLAPFSLESTKLFDLIQEVPLLEIQAVPMPSKRQNQLYKGFFSTTVCTKWQCLLTFPMYVNVGVPTRVRNVERWQFSVV